MPCKAMAHSKQVKWENISKKMAKRKVISSVKTPEPTRLLREFPFLHVHGFKGLDPMYISDRKAHQENMKSLNSA